MRILLMAVILVLGGHILIGAVGEVLGGRRTVRGALGWLLFGIGLLILAISGLWSRPFPTAIGYLGVVLVITGLFLERHRMKLPRGEEDGGGEPGA